MRQELAELHKGMRKYADALAAIDGVRDVMKDQVAG
jgi:hypothetical protein